MGATLEDTLAELAALDAAQTGTPPPPVGAPTRPPLLQPTKAAKGGASPVSPGGTPQKAPKAGGEGVLSKVMGFFNAGSELVGKGLIANNSKDAVDAQAEVHKGALMGVVRAPGQLLGAVADTNADVGKFIGETIERTAVRAGVPRKAASVIAGGFTTSDDMRQKAFHGATTADVLSMRASLGQVGNPMVNQAMAEFASLAIPVGGEVSAAVSSSAKVANLLRSSALVAGTTFAIQTPEGNTAGDRNVSRAKNAGIAFAANMAFEPLLGAVLGHSRAARTKVVAASPEEGAKDALDRSFAAGRTQEARYQVQEAKDAQPTPAPEGVELPPEEPLGQEFLPSGTRRADAEPGPSGDDVRPAGSSDDGSGVEAPVPEHLADADAALKLANASEPLDATTHPVRSDGRIPVAQGTKDALDEAGLGKAFAASTERDPGNIIFKEVGPDGEGRVVGMMGRQDLAEFEAELRTNMARGEAKGPSSLDIRDADSPTGNWKIGNLGTTWDTPAYLRGIVDHLGESVERQAVTHEGIMTAARENADAIGMNVDDMLAYATAVQPAYEKLPEQIATIRTVWARSSRSLDDLSTTDFTLAEDATIQEALQSVNNMVKLTASVMEVKAGTGRALQVWGLPDADTYFSSFGKVPKNTKPDFTLPPLPRDKQELQQWMDMWKATKNNPEARQMFLQGLTFTPGKWKYLGNSITNFWTGAILSGPVTLLRNVTGPVVVSALRTVERSAGAYAASLNPFTSPSQRKELLATASAAPIAYAQAMGHITTALKYSMEALLSGRSRLGGHNQFDISIDAMPPALREAATAKNPGITGDIPYLLGNFINMFPRGVRALHTGTTELALQVSYQGEVLAAARVEGAKLGLDGRALKDFIQDRITKSTDQLGQATDAAAMGQAERTSMVRSPDRDLDPAIRMIAQRAVSQLRDNVPGFRFIVPIFNSPANALGEAIRRLPVGALFKETRSELVGEAGPIQQAEAYGRLMSGAAVLAYGALLAHNGDLTGAGPQDANDRKLWLEQGYEPYSVRIGDQWVSFAKLDVLGAVLSIPASIHDKTVHTQVDQANLGFAGAAALAQFFKDQSALQGVAELMNFGSDPVSDKGFFTRLANNTARGFVPNFVNQMGRNNADPLNRTVRSPWDAVMNMLPGASATLDPQRNLMGEPTYKVQNAGWNTLPVSMSKMNTYADDPVIDEMARLYEVTGYAPGVLSPASKGGNFDLRDVQLEDGHSAYDAMMRYRTIATIDGVTLREALTSLFDSPEYNEAVDGDTSNATTSTDEASRGYLVSRVFSDYNRAAEREVANASPLAARLLAVAAAKRADDTTLRDYKAADLVKSPELLVTLGIPIDAYEAKVKGE